MEWESRTAGGGGGEERTAGLYFFLINFVKLFNF